MLNLLACLLSLSLAAEVPFWKSKAKVHERIENGEVIVSVNAKDVSPQVPRYEMRVVGGGQVTAPCDFVYKAAQNYEEIALLSGYIKKAHYNAATQMMDFIIDAFFYSSAMSLEIKSHTEPIPKIDFRLASGPMKGFQWQMTFTDAALRKCEVGIDGNYKYAEFPIRRLFLEYGMQSVFQSMAQRLRGHVEDRYHAASKATKTARADNPVDNWTLKWNNSGAF
ncbi:MAG: hypothetical protein ACXVA9_11975 [Bdellovibrionales bacterium]